MIGRAIYEKTHLAHSVYICLFLIFSSIITTSLSAVAKDLGEFYTIRHYAYYEP